MFLRTLYWRIWAKHMGKNVRIYGRALLASPEFISIGDDTSINEGVLIAARGPITIGNRVRISAGVKIISGSLDYNASLKERQHTEAPIVVEDGVWLCAGATILQGTRIGENSVIAAGAVVVSSIPPNVLAAGIPARVIRQL